MTIQWNDYQQQALSTAIYPLKRELEYTVLGLCSEVGEVGIAYTRGKGLWGFTQEMTNDLLKEVGDVYWYCAAVADALNTPLQHIWDNFTDAVHPSRSRGLTILQVVGCSSEMAGVVKKAIRDNDGFLPDAGAEIIRYRLGETLVLLDHLVRYFGSTPEAVMSGNLNKLADRKQRGVLQGSGDLR